MDARSKEIVERTATTVILIVCTSLIQTASSDFYWYAKNKWFRNTEDEYGV